MTTKDYFSETNLPEKLKKNLPYYKKRKRKSMSKADMVLDIYSIANRGLTTRNVMVGVYNKYKVILTSTQTYNINSTLKQQRKITPVLGQRGMHRIVYPTLY